MYLKNVDDAFSINMHDNPNLQHICASPNKINYLQQIASLEGYTSCVVDSDCSFELANDTFENPWSIVVYPNPVRSVLNINQQKTNATVTIYNSMGQMVFSNSGSGPTRSIDVSSLKSGNYFLKVISDEGIFTTKFIKE